MQFFHINFLKCLETVFRSRNVAVKSVFTFLRKLKFLQVNVIHFKRAFKIVVKIHERISNASKHNNSSETNEKCRVIRHIIQSIQAILKLNI